MTGCREVVQCYRESRSRQAAARRSGDRAVRGLSSFLGAGRARDSHAEPGNVHVRSQFDASVVSAWAIAQSIRWARLKAGLTQERLSALTGIARPNIVRIESGKHSPTLATLEKIAIALGTEPAALMRKPIPDHDDDARLAESGLEDLRLELEEEDQR